MSQSLVSEREAIANAACDVAGRERPLSAALPKADRVYLFACPAEDGGQFCPEDLSERLEKSPLVHGVDWDRSSETYGLRFVSVSQPLPAELKPFAGRDAQNAWRAWRDEQAEMTKVVSLAAGRAAAGEALAFKEDGEPEQVRKPRRGFLKGKERD